MNKFSISSKWDRIYENSADSEPANVLLENKFLLPDKGVSLDLACGLGENALFLAEKGLTSHAWDISSIALDKLKKKAKKRMLAVFAKQLYIELGSLPENTFDVIVLSHFLDRTLCNEIMDSLKPDGLLFYQTYVRDKLTSDGPRNPDFLLARNELINLFNPLKILMYRENSLVGDLSYGERNTALFVGQKC